MKKITFISLMILSVKLFCQSYTGKLGYGLSPQGFPVTFNQLPAFFSEVAGTCNGGIVMGNGSWRDSLAASGQLPLLHKFVSNSQPSPYGYMDMLVFGWASYPQLYLDAPGNPTNNWTNSVTKGLFLQTLKSAADSLKPSYLFIGNEINFYWEQDSSDFLNWSAFYSQAYDTVKKYSPTTKVGTIYNYEDLSGQGALVGYTASRWGALTMMDTAKMDVIGFTVYPFLSTGTAASVPANYFDAMFNHIGNKHIVITETGWPADSTQAGALWAASPNEQITYVNKLFSLINGHPVEDVNWLFLNYLMSHNGSENIFRSVALRDSLGNDRPALSAWLSQCGTTTAVSINESAEIQVFPNPFNETFYVNVPEGGLSTIRIHDVLGNLVYEERASKHLTEINADLLPGIYFVSVTDGVKIISKKIIRQ